MIVSIYRLIFLVMYVESSLIRRTPAHRICRDFARNAGPYLRNIATTRSGTP